MQCETNLIQTRHLAEFNVSGRLFSLAGLPVTISGRFWVTVKVHSIEALRRGVRSDCL